MIEILGNNASIESKLEEIGERVATTTVNKYELLKGPRAGKTNALVETMVIYDFDSVSAERSGKIFKELRDKGRMINEFDILIASIAMAHDELLVTRDSDFKKIGNLKVVVI